MKFRIGLLVFAFVASSLSLSAQTTEINYLEIGLNQNKSGNYADALRNFSLEIEKTAANPNPIAYYNRGFAKYNLKDFQGAILDFNKAIELKPMYFEAFIARGQSHSKQDKHPLAIQDYNEAIRLNPLEGTAYFSRGISKNKIESYRAAITDFNKSLELERDNVWLDEVKEILYDTACKMKIVREMHIGEAPATPNKFCKWCSLYSRCLEELT
jgi:tetratricopeptide (TPR) repeat protein